METSTDTITLSGLRVHGRHGVFDFERQRGQDFIVDVTLATSTKLAAQTDDIDDTIDYGLLSDKLAEIIGGEPVNLLETLAQRLADACLADSRVAEVTVTVHKPQAPITHSFTDVSVSICRRNQ